MKKLTAFVVSSFLPLALVAGCSDDDESPSVTSGEGGETGDGTTGETGDPETGDAEETGTDTTGDDECTADAPCPLSGTVDADLTLAAGGVYVLTDEVVVTGATLTIESGVTVRGTQGSYLVIEKDGYIDVQGTAEAPVIMTSNSPNPQAGDWGGLVLLGTATTNVGTAEAEGFAVPPTYGGNDDAHACGSLVYLQVRYAGFAITDGNELNGISFYACGTGTNVNWVQVHKGYDDGMEFFGGAFDVQHAVLTGVADDSIDCDQGFHGSFSDVFIHQAAEVGDNAFEISNQEFVYDASPLTSPTITHATIIGGGVGAENSKGMTLKEGTEATFTLSLFTNIVNSAFNIQNAETRAALENTGSTITDNIFSTADATVPLANIVPDGDVVYWEQDEFLAWLNGDDAENPLNTIAVDDAAAPLLTSITWGSPDITPVGDVTSSDGNGYRGAVDPAGENWTLGWTDFSE